MNVTTPHMPTIAKCYGIDRTHAYRLRRRHGLTAEQLFDTDFVFSRLLESGRGSPLRTRLSNPATRAEIRKALQ